MSLLKTTPFVFLLTSFAGKAQEIPVPPETIQVPLTVPSAAPLRVYITQRLRMRDGEAVRARLIDPIYAFDRVVVPSGVELAGHVSRFDSVSKMGRLQAVLQGDFTPLHWARVQFTELTMPDGRVIPITTGDSLGLPTLYVAPRPSHRKSSPKNSGVLGTAKQQVKQRIEAKTQSVIDVVRGPNKKEWLEDFLVKKLPYHPQWYRRNTRFDALLGSPLDFGSATLPASTIRNIGLPSVECIAQVRLLTSISSADAGVNTKVEGVLSQPLFSADQKLLLPEGTHLTGHVRHAQAARWFHRGGQLRFTFDQVELPVFTSLKPLPLTRMEAQLAGAEADPGAGVKVDPEGNARATEPKSRLLGPAIALLVATRGLENDHERRGVTVPSSGKNYSGRAPAGISGFGLLGAAAARASSTAGSVLGFYGLGWSVYSTIISRGQEVQFEENTALEIRFGTPAADAASKLAKHIARTPTK